jgi:hypothetical protein
MSEVFPIVNPAKNIKEFEMNVMIGFETQR